MLLVLLAPVPAQAAPLPPENYVVGYADGLGPSVLAAAGIVPVREHAGLGIATVTIPDSVAATLRLSSHIEFVVPNTLAFFGAATGWDATGWDATGWDATGWDATGWDATGWDATGWDATGWDATGWDATGWDAVHWNATGWDATGWDSASLSAWGADARADGKDPLFGRQWGHRAAFAGAALAQATAAASTTICVLDSGVDASHPDLADAMWRDPATGTTGYDFVNDDADPADDAWHGTNVAGIAAAVSGNGIGIMGASKAKIMSVKVLDATGRGLESDLAFGIAWCVDHGAKVVSMSLGSPLDSKPVKRAIVDAHARGAVLVAAIGNEGRCSSCDQYPAHYAQVIGVGAITPTGYPARFSTVSADVDLAAPGAAIVGPIPGARYGAFNGTSQAAPWVAAAAALMLDADPTLTPGEIESILRATATDLGPAGRDNYVGWGALRMDLALAQAQS